MYDHTLSYMLVDLNHQIRNQAARNVGCQPGDCRWLLNLLQGFTHEYLCMGSYIYFITPDRCMIYNAGRTRKHQADSIKINRGVKKMPTQLPDYRSLH